MLSFTTVLQDKFLKKLSLLSLNFAITVLEKAVIVLSED